jgi:pyruvate kinase
MSGVAKGHEYENALSMAAVMTAEKLEISVIAVNVSTQEDIRSISDRRPGRPVIAVAKDENIYRKLAMFHGANPVMAKGGMMRAINTIKKKFKGAEKVVYVDFHGQGKNKGGIQIF